MKIVKIPHSSNPSKKAKPPQTKAQKRAKREIARKMANRSSFDPPKLEKPTNSRMKRRAKEMRAKPTKAEARMVERLIEAEIAHETQQVLGWYIADIVIPTRMLIIELDGHHHYTDKGSLSDFRRTQWLQQFGFTVLRCPNEQVEAFDLTQINSYPTNIMNEYHRNKNAANKERNRALYYPPVQQDKYKAKRKRENTEDWRRVPQIDDKGRIVR